MSIFALLGVILLFLCAIFYFAPLAGSPFAAHLLFLVIVGALLIGIGVVSGR